MSFRDKTRLIVWGTKKAPTVFFCNLEPQEKNASWINQLGDPRSVIRYSTVDLKFYQLQVIENQLVYTGYFAVHDWSGRKNGFVGVSLMLPLGKQVIGGVLPLLSQLMEMYRELYVGDDYKISQRTEDPQPFFDLVERAELVDATETQKVPVEVNKAGVVRFQRGQMYNIFGAGVLPAEFAAFDRVYFLPAGQQRISHAPTLSPIVLADKDSDVKAEELLVKDKGNGPVRPDREKSDQSITPSSSSAPQPLPPLPPPDAPENTVPLAPTEAKMPKQPVPPKRRERASGRPSEQGGNKGQRVKKIIFALMVFVFLFSVGWGGLKAYTKKAQSEYIVAALAKQREASLSFSAGKPELVRKRDRVVALTDTLLQIRPEAAVVRYQKLVDTTDAFLENRIEYYKFQLDRVVAEAREYAEESNTIRLDTAVYAGGINDLLLDYGKEWNLQLKQLEQGVKSLEEAIAEVNAQRYRYFAEQDMMRSRIKQFANSRMLHRLKDYDNYLYLLKTKTTEFFANSREGKVLGKRIEAMREVAMATYRSHQPSTEASGFTKLAKLAGDPRLNISQQKMVKRLLQ